MADKIIFEAVLQTNTAQARKELQKLNRLAKSTVGDVNINSRLIGSEKLLSSLKTIQGQINTINRSSARLGTGISSKTAKDLSGLSRVIDKTNTSLRQSEKVLKSGALASQDFGRQAALAVKRYSGYVIAARVVFGLEQAIERALSVSIKFNRELLKIAQVSDVSIRALGEIRGTIDSLSVRFGANSQELLKAAQIFAQAGFSLRQVNEAIQALGPTSLAPTFDSLEKSAQGSLAIIKQFKLETSDLNQVLDVLNEVSAKSAVTVQDLFDGIKRFGSVASLSEGVQNNVQGLRAFKDTLAVFCGCCRYYSTDR